MDSRLALPMHSPSIEASAPRQGLLASIAMLALGGAITLAVAWTTLLGLASVSTGGPAGFPAFLEFVFMSLLAGVVVALLVCPHVRRWCSASALRATLILAVGAVGIWFLWPQSLLWGVPL